MRMRHLISLALLLVILAAAGCADMNKLQTSPTGSSSMMDCNGDLPSPYPPYCHPIHN